VPFGSNKGNMIKKCNLSVPAALLGCFLVLSFLLSQEKPQESVTVTAVEIPVRVFDGNGFVAGLTKDDFEVFENGVKQDITGFEAVSRSILPDSVEAPGAIPKSVRKRNFILIFNVYAYTDDIGEAIDFFFKNVFSPGDRLVTLVNEGLVQIKGDGGGEEIASRLKQVLLEVKKSSLADLNRTFLDLEKKAEDLAASLDPQGSMSSQYGADDVFTNISRFLDDYQRVWIDYGHRKFDINLDLYKTIANRMGKLDGDKWAVCFQQREVFPKIKNQGRLTEELKQALDSQEGVDPRASQVLAQRQALERSFNVNVNFPGAKIQELFTQANVTFHVLLMKPVSAQAGSLSADLDIGEVRAEYEDTLRKISRSTGGVTIFSNKVLETLKEASVKTDRYYLLVYQPQKGLVNPENKIEVRIKREGIEVVSLKERTPVKTEGITIFNFEAGPKSIAFRLKNYARAPLEWQEQGRAMIKVTIFDDQSAKVFSKETTLNLVADTIRVSLDFPALAAGNYLVLIEAYDVVGGEKAVFSQAVRFE
jgi:VWFA-related protein